MKDKISEFFNPTEEQRYKKLIETFRENHIPEKYNQVKLLDELNNPEIDHYMSISNRTDGKSINYIHTLLYIAYEYDLGLTLITRNMMLRASYQDLIEDIIEISDIFDRSDITFIRSQYYVRVDYKGRNLAIITDLNNATELKNFSNFLKKYPIIVYDEFIALETDYLPDEWQRLKTIYESIDRIEEYPLIKKPKLFYLGNAVNFDSPILHGLKIFNILENHPMNTARIYKYDFNVMLEINRNENANETRNTRAFGGGDDAMSTARFESNSHNVATDNDRNHVKHNPRVIYVKVKNDYIKIWFNADTLNTIISVEHSIDDIYQYNLLLKDNRESSQFLNGKYFDENHIKRIDRGDYLFDNKFSKDYITSDFNGLNELRINKLIRETLRKDNESIEVISKERQFKENYIEKTKRGLMRKLWG